MEMDGPVGEKSLDGNDGDWTLRLLGEKSLLEGMGCCVLEREGGGLRGDGRWCDASGMNHHPSHSARIQILEGPFSSKSSVHAQEK
jgi:hypothetical protein